MHQHPAALDVDFAIAIAIAIAFKSVVADIVHAGDLVRRGQSEIALVREVLRLLLRVLMLMLRNRGLFVVAHVVVSAGAGAVVVVVRVRVEDDDARAQERMQALPRLDGLVDEVARRQQVVRRVDDERIGQYAALEAELVVEDDLGGAQLAQDDWRFATATATATAAATAEQAAGRVVVAVVRGVAYAAADAGVVVHAQIGGAHVRTARATRATLVDRVVAAAAASRKQLAHSRAGAATTCLSVVATR